MRKGRKPCCDKSKVKKGAWTPSEDSNLITFIQNFGHSNWRTLPSQAGLLRCGKSCRLRWINYLRPDVKRGNFTATEEEDIIKLHQTYGNKWSKIASFLPGRTDNEIKNIWNTHLIKKLGIKSKKRNTSKRVKSKKPCNGFGVESPSEKSDQVAPENTCSDCDTTSPLVISCNSESSSHKQSRVDMDMSFGASREAIHLEGFGALDELSYWNIVELDNLCSLQTAEIQGYPVPYNAFEEPGVQNNQLENWARNLEIDLGLDDIH